MKDAEDFFNALKPALRRLIQTETEGCLRCADYTVSTAPSGGLLGVRRSSEGCELFVRFAPELASAVPGDSELLLRRGSLSDAYAVRPF